MENGTLSSVKFSGCKCRKTASFDFKLKKRGKKFNVYKGRMHSCCADIQYAAVKARANEKGSSSDLVDYVIALEAAINIALRFSKCFKNNLTVQFPELHLAVMDNVSVFNKLFSKGSRALSSEEYVLFEPYIKDLKYFVTAEGIVTDTCPVVIQELCHFSYHESNGMNVLRGLRGAWEKNGKSFRLASAFFYTFVQLSICDSKLYFSRFPIFYIKLPLQNIRVSSRHLLNRLTITILSHSYHNHPALLTLLTKTVVFFNIYKKKTTHLIMTC